MQAIPRTIAVGTAVIVSTLVAIFAGKTDEEARCRPLQDYPTYGIDVELAKEIPGYGGHYYDEKRRLVVNLTNPAADSATAYDVLIPRSAETGRPATAIVARKAKYTVGDLICWRYKITHEVTFDRITSIGIRIQDQKIMISTDNLADKNALIRAIEDLGIPLDTVSIGIGKGIDYEP